MSEKPLLKYLFIADFIDGTSLAQTSDDVSAIDPEKRSQFYDVLQSGKKIKQFSLIGEGNILRVDLISGLFYINSLPILVESNKLPRLPDEFNLIFYRQWTQSTNITYETKDGHINDMSPTSSFCEYFIGWQCNINGKNYQVKIAVS